MNDGFVVPLKNSLWNCPSQSVLYGVPFPDGCGMNRTGPNGRGMVGAGMMEADQSFGLFSDITFMKYVPDSGMETKRNVSGESTPKPGWTNVLFGSIRGLPFVYWR